MVSDQNAYVFSVLCKRRKYLRGSRSVGGSDWLRARKGKGLRGGRKGQRRAEAPKIVSKRAELLTAPGVRAEKESRHCIRSSSVNSTVHRTNERGHRKSERLV